MAVPDDRIPQTPLSFPEAPPGAPNARHAKPPRDFGDFIEKEKAEVYLLLDFLSGRPDKKIREEKLHLVVPTKDPCQPEKLIEKPLIDAICEVRWPPEGMAHPPASEAAALLLKARDQLAGIASPACGASIAFTTLTANTSAMLQDIARISVEHMPLCASPKGPHAAHAILENALAAYPHYPALALSFIKRKRVIEYVLPAALFITVIGTAVSTYLGHPPGVPFKPGVTPPAPENVRPWLIVLNVNVLPTLYGLVGACCGVLRGVQLKMRESLLMPRDRVSIIMQVWFGVVMGFTIGLFKNTIAPSGDLSFSALSFLAGLAADSVFAKLDDLLKTLFGTKAAAPHGT